MKREAINHTKMKRLCRRLNIHAWQAVGLLESLWHLTARETPRGDIGKLSDDDIAIGIDYHGDAVDMLAALVDCRWLDVHPDHRLLVHHWPDHCDDSVNMKLARAKQFFADGSAPKLTRLGAAEKEAAAQFYAAPDPGPKPCAQNDDPPESEEKGYESKPCAQTGDPCAQTDPCARRAPRLSLSLDLDPALTLTLTPPPKDTSLASRKNGVKAIEDSSDCVANANPKQKPKYTQDDHTNLALAMARYRDPIGRTRDSVLPPSDIVDSVLAKLELGNRTVPDFCQHLRTLPAVYRPGGKHGPRKWEWFIGVAFSFASAEVTQTPTAERCRHNKEWGICCLPPAQYDKMTAALDGLDGDAA